MPHGTNKIKAEQPTAASVASDYNAALVLRRRASGADELSSLPRERRMRNWSLAKEKYSLSKQSIGNSTRKENKW